jgi:hypothetical protein
MQGAATQAMSFIVEERQRSRCPPAAAPRRAAGFDSSNFRSGVIAFFHRWKPAAECEVILARALSLDCDVSAARDSGTHAGF